MDGTAETKQAFERPQWYLESRGYNIRIRAGVIQKLLGNREFARILDIGCGNGSLSVPLLSPDRRLTLLDLSARMLDLARSRVPGALSSRVETINTGFMQARLEAASYDLIICMGVLAYVDDLPAFIAKLTSLLKPGGVIFMECTDSRHGVSRLISFYEKLLGLFRPPKVRLFVRPSAEVVTAFNRLGYELCANRRYSLIPPVVRKFLGQNLQYQIVHFVFGVPDGNRNAWLGNECIFLFHRSRRRAVEIPNATSATPAGGAGMVVEPVA